MIKEKTEKPILTIISTVLITTLLGLVSWLAVFIWDIDNKVQYLMNYHSLLITPNGDIRASIEVEILKVKVNNLEKEIDNIKDKK